MPAWDDVNRRFTVALVVLSAIALFLPTRSQTFTRVAVEGRAMRMLVSGTGSRQLCSRTDSALRWRCGEKFSLT